MKSLKKGEKHCCINMDYYVAESKEIYYEAEYRCYSLKLTDDNKGTRQILWYCPWCGSKLPATLHSEWFNILKAEYGICDPIFDDAAKVPPEFKTDEWWRRQGL